MEGLQAVCNSFRVTVTVTTCLNVICFFSTADKEKLGKKDDSSPFKVNVLGKEAVWVQKGPCAEAGSAGVCWTDDGVLIYFSGLTDRRHYPRSYTAEK